MRPDERDAALLHDILGAGRKAQASIEGCTLEALRNDWMRCLALERSLEIVGEAAGRISPALRQAYPAIAWQDARALRNVLAHDYDNIDHERLYQTTREQLPLLLTQISRLLDEVREVRGVYLVPRGVPLPMSVSPSMNAPRAPRLNPPRASRPSPALRLSRARA